MYKATGAPQNFSSAAHRLFIISDTHFPVSQEVHHAVLHTVEPRQQLTRAVGSAGYGVVHYHSAYVGAGLDCLVKAVDHTAAAGHDYSVVPEISD